MSRSIKKEVLINIDEGYSASLVVPVCWVKPMVMCLCGNCASRYYEDSVARIVRANKKQKRLDQCNICGSNRGYDFVVFENNKNYKKAWK